MSFQDSAVIFFIALLLFGPKKLPELARQLGKLMGEFRRASNEFRMQLDDELRSAEQADKQKKIAALEAAAPPVTQAASTTEMTPAVDLSPTPATRLADAPDLQPAETTATSTPEAAQPAPIASSGDLHLHPPATGLPVARGSVSAALDSFPEAAPDRSRLPDPLTNGSASAHAPEETAQHG